VSCQPLLSYLYINDWITYLKTFIVIIPIGRAKLLILFYADDTIILNENDDGLETLLTDLQDVCNRNNMYISNRNIKIVHFRPPSISVLTGLLLVVIMNK
jgi:hypothetical protein